MAFLPAPNETVLMLVGEIEKGDYAKFQALLQYRVPNQVVLDSPGGDYLEALEIARDVNLLGVRTIAPIQSCTKGEDVSCRCASSCFFIWAAGRQRLGDIVMIHLPQTPPRLKGEDRRLAAAAIADHVAWFLNKIELPHSIIDAVLKTPFQSPRSLTEAELRLLANVDEDQATAKVPWPRRATTEPRRCA